MTEPASSVLGDPAVRAAIGYAWQDSCPGPSGGYEEGGFVLRHSTGALTIILWPKGDQNSILLPGHTGCRIGGDDIIMSFHTHPNTGDDHLQEPGQADLRGVRDDPDLKAPFYLGELVVSQQTIYLIFPTGQVTALGDTSQLLAGE